MSRNWSPDEEAGTSADPLLPDVSSPVASVGSTMVVAEASVPASEGDHETPSAGASLTLARHAAMTHHPEVQLLMDRALHGDGATADNLCTVVGTIRVERARGGRERRTTTTLGDQQHIYRLSVYEELGAESGVAKESYRMRLSISQPIHDRYQSLLVDDQRVIVVGPLRMEPTYDSRFATGALDAGRKTWAIQLDVIDVATAGPEEPDYSHVQLVGTVEEPPIVRYRVIGEVAPRQPITVPFASVLLRNRIRVRGAARNSRAAYNITTVVPLMVPLDGALEHAAMLLKKGNEVYIEGRLLPYDYRRNPNRDTQLMAVIEKETQRLQQAGAQAWQIRNAQQQLLTAIQWTVAVGYIEPRHGTPLPDDEIARLLDDPRSGRRSHAPQGRAAQEADGETVTAQLDAATQRAFEPADEETSSVSNGTPARVRPRRRERVEEALPQEVDTGATA